MASEVEQLLFLLRKRARMALCSQDKNDAPYLPQLADVGFESYSAFANSGQA
jgi:hypothetical protein